MRINLSPAQVYLLLYLLDCFLDNPRGFGSSFVSEVENLSFDLQLAFDSLSFDMAVDAQQLVEHLISHEGGIL